MIAPRLYLRYIALSIRAQLQYRVNFFFHVLANLLVTGTEFLGLWAAFHRFGSLQDWSLPEVALLYGIIGTAFAIAEAVPRGFDVFPRLVKSGDFDRLLLRPRSTVLQILGHELQLLRIGRFSQALAVLLWAAATLDVTWTLPNIALLTAAIAGGACLFTGLFILGATLSFWTVESLEIVNITTYGGVEAGQFPITLFHPILRWAMVVFIPLATINYFPAHALLNRADPLGTPALFHVLSPLVGVAFLLLSLLVWRVGVRHYTSTGS